MSASRKDPVCDRHVVLTGATGFLGKVVLCELLRQVEDCRVQSITLLVRKQGARSARARIFDHALGLACFDGLRHTLESRVEVVEADLTVPNLAMAQVSRELLCARTTHIIHCAASVDFDRPLDEAALSNIHSSLNILALAKTMPQLQSLTVTSTAYVTPHAPGPIREALVSLPRPAEAIFADIESKQVPQRELLEELGHANTYTYTKCIAEHLLVERRGTVPLRIVRPSIISAAWRHPMPGWIDSRAAFAGFVVTIGAGILRVIDANPHVRLDLVPVDVVAEALLTSAFSAQGSADVGVPIVHAVAGKTHGAHIGRTSNAIVKFFRKRPIGRRASLAYLGPRTWRFAAAYQVHQVAPASLASAAFAMRRDQRGLKKVRRLADTVQTINEVFPYFTHHTFEFLSSHALPSDFQTEAYVERVCAGAYTHLMHRNGRQVPFAGAHARHARSDAAWVATRAEGSAAARAQALATRVLARQVFAAVTVDEPSFLRAQSGTAEARGTGQVAFLPVGGGAWGRRLCRLLALSRPDLGMSLDDVVAVTPTDVRGDSLDAFFRAPSAQALQRMCEQRGVSTIVPIAVSVHVADGGLPSSPWQRAQRWASERVRATASLGGAQSRAHVQAGAPVELAADGSYANLAHAIRAQAASAFVPTQDDLTSFLRLHPQVGLDAEQLTRALVGRGAQLLPSIRPHAGGLVDVPHERRVRRLWQSWLAPDLLARFGNALPLQAMFVQQVAQPSEVRPRTDKRLHGVLDALAEPIAADFAATIHAVARLLPVGARATTRALLAEAHLQDEHTGLTALVALCDAGVLSREHEHGLSASTVVFRRLADTDVLKSLLEQCRVMPHHDRRRSGIRMRTQLAPIGSATLH